MNTSTWELSMTPQLVSTVWISTLCWLDPAREYKEERTREAPLDNSKRSARKNQSNGLLRNSEVPYSERNHLHTLTKLEIT